MLRESRLGFTPPFTALHATRDALTSNRAFLLGAQNLHWEEKGAFTGEVSGPMLKDLGCNRSFVVILNVASNFETRIPGRTGKCWQPPDMDSSRFLRG